MDFHKATEAICQVIVFMQSLTHMTNNCRNVECRIQQCETRQAESHQSTMSQEQEPRQSELPQTQSPIPLPPPGVGAYCPPMLCEAPPHLKFKATHSDATPAAALSTPSAHEVDGHCRGATPIPVTSLADASTQTDMEIPPINSQKSPENSEKSTENSGNTSYGNIEDPTLHSLALALPFSKEREIDLAKLIYLDDWESRSSDWGGLTSVQRLHFHILYEIMSPRHPHPQDRLWLHSPIYNLFVHWCCGWNGLSEFLQEDRWGRYSYLTREQSVRRRSFH